MEQSGKASRVDPPIVDVHSLPEELIQNILIDVIVEELLEEKFAKFHLKDRVSERLMELESVCRKWKSILSLSTEYLQMNIIRQLNSAGVKPFLVMNVGQGGSAMTKLDNKLYVFVAENTKHKGAQRDPFVLQVHRQKDDILELEVSRPLQMEMEYINGCVVCHSSVYALTETGEVWKIDPQDLSQSSFSYISWPARLSVSKDGDLLILIQYGDYAVEVYGPDGEVLDSIDLPDHLEGVIESFFQKMNGNIVIYSRPCPENVSTENDWIREIDRDGNVIWELENQPNLFNGNLWFDKDEQLMMTIDKDVRELYVYDNGLRRHSFTIPDVSKAPDGYYLKFSSAYYDAEENILYISSSIHPSCASASE